MHLRKIKESLCQSIICLTLLSASNELNRQRQSLCVDHDIVIVTTVSRQACHRQARSGVWAIHQIAARGCVSPIGTNPLDLHGNDSE
jgi:hypothetical protein